MTGGEPTAPTAPAWTRPLPGLLLAAVGLGIGWLIHSLLPAVPLLTACVALGLIAGQLPIWGTDTGKALGPGLALSSRRLLRIGVVLLGLKLSLGDIAALGWQTIAVVVAILVITFFLTIGVGRLFRLPGDQPLLIAAGFSICGASAIGAVSAVTKSKSEDTATPVALVTLFGTLAIVVLPVLQAPLGLSAPQFGAWAGASVHDVGQVVATAQIAGASALAIAVTVKLTRVLMLAPMVAGIAVVARRRGTVGARPPIVPLFVAGFIAMVLVRSFIPLPGVLLGVADTAQTMLLGMALFALGSSIRLRAMARTGGRAALVGLISWAIIAVLALGGVLLVSPTWA